MSRSLVEEMIVLLSSGKVLLQDKRTLDLLHRFFAVIAPGTLRPVDPLLESVMNASVDMTSLKDVQNWLGFIVVALPILTNQSPEEGILGRLHGLGIKMTVSVDGSPSSTATLLDTSIDSSLSSDGVEQEVHGARPEFTMAKFLIQVIGAACTKYHQLVFSQWIESQTSFLLQQLSHLLLFVIYMFQSGRYYKVTRAAQTISKKISCSDMMYTIDFITELFIQLAHVSPFLTLQWCYILKLIKYCPHSTWSKIIGPAEDGGFTSLNGQILRKGGVILLSDHLCDNVSTEVEITTWLVMNHMKEVVRNIKENPVQDFVISVHSSSAPISGLILQAVISKVSPMAATRISVLNLRDILSCIENVHNAHSGKLIMFLVRSYLGSPHLSLAKHASGVACGKIEVLMKVTPSECEKQLSRDEIGEILETLQRMRLVKRFVRFATLISKLAVTHKYDISPLETTDDYYGRSFFSPGSLSTVRVDRSWLIGQIRVRCCQPSCFQNWNSNGVVCAKMLSLLNDREDILEIMRLKDFNLAVLSFCFEPGEGNIPTLVATCAKDVLTMHVEKLVTDLPSKVCFYRPRGWTASNEDQLYSELMDNFFRTESFQSTLVHVTYGFEQITSRELGFQSPDGKAGVIARFCLLLLEFSKWLTNHSNSSQDTDVPATEDYISAAMNVVGDVANRHQYADEIEQYANSLCFLLVDLLDDKFPSQHGPVDMCATFKDMFEAGNETPAVFACTQLNNLFSELVVHYTDSASQSNRLFSMPSFWQKGVRKLIIAIGRLPSFNSYVTIPPEIWKLDWRIDPIDPETPTVFPYIPVDMLRDMEILCNYIIRIHILGWRTRQQFEETWMTLLGIFSLSDQELSDEEVNHMGACSSKVVEAITSLLLQTMSLPNIGHGIMSDPIHHPRGISSLFILTDKGHQLTGIQNSIFGRVLSCTGRIVSLPMYGAYNLDKIHNVDWKRGESHHRRNYLEYGLGQLSISYITSAVRANEMRSSPTRVKKLPGETSSVLPLSFIQREETMAKVGLDLKSCVRFLMDIYSQWLETSAEGGLSPPLGLITESVRSIVLLSDLFVEEQHFEWMLDKFQLIQRSHPMEDEILTSLLTVGICKALSVVGTMEQTLIERVKKSLENGLKSSNLSVQTMHLQGILYIIQRPFERASTDDIFTALATEYMHGSMHRCISNSTSDYHQGTMWALAFHLIEHAHINDEVIDGAWSFSTCLMAIKYCNETTAPIPSYGLYLTLLGCLERLVISGTSLLQEKEGTLFNHIVKLCTDLLTETNPALVLPATQLFLACMYYSASSDRKRYAVDSSSSSDTTSPTSNAIFDPDKIMQFMEQLSILFDAVRRSDVQQAKLLCCNVLPRVVAELVPASDLINRVINEFISPGQPHQVLLSGVLFDVFKNAILQDQVAMLQEWVLMALPNFVDRSPISHSVWYLTVFFMSAISKNRWLQATFPHLQQRFGLYQNEDKKLFCLAGKYFYNELESDGQKENFMETFKKAPRQHTPYNDLVQSLLSNEYPG